MSFTNENVLFENKPVYEIQDINGNSFRVKMVPSYPNVWASECGKIFQIDLDQLEFRQAWHTNKKKYIRASINIGEIAKFVTAHRLVALVWLANPESKATVNHKNFDTHDNSVGNLEWMTDAENHKHAKDFHPNRSTFREYRDFCNGLTNVKPASSQF